MEEMIIAADLHYAVPSGTARWRIPSLRVRSGARIGLRGESGAGKSTLLGLMAGLLPAERGQLRVAGVELVGASGGVRREHRLRSIGQVLQGAPLVDHLSLLDNVLLPLRLAGRRLGAHRDRAVRLLDAVGLEDRLYARPGALSEGERQRVAVARSLVGDPPLLLADEPTSGLDPLAAARVLDLLLAGERTLVVASHDEAVLARLESVSDVASWRVG